MKKYIVFILIFVMAAFGVGCQSEETSAVDPDLVYLYDFEQWAPDVQLLRIMNGFGDISWNENPEFVKHGEKSIKMRPLGEYSSDNKPYVYIPTVSEIFEIKMQDFSQIEYVKIDFYNATESEVNVYFGFVFNELATDIVEAASESLRPGWNEVFFKPEKTVINISYDLSNCNGFYLMFDNIKSRDIEDAPVIYADNIAIKTDRSFVMTDLVQLKENEVCDFESLYQEYILKSSSAKMMTKPVLSVVRASDYGLTAPSGTRILRVYAPAGEVVEASWPRLIFASKVIQKAEFDEYDHEDIFAFDIYNNSDVGLRIYPEYLTSADRGGAIDSILATPRTWVTYRITLGEIHNFKELKLLDDLHQIRIAYGEFLGADKEIFFDNFRVEKAMAVN